ncbi:secretion/DNA translocation related TadE-like protein [Streptomyces sp. BK022]|uniref:Rv3654c family TadE-like protein n=1 Tax=Streptomyces sp. BK022 TaxID=2512123 RepID=UPI001029D9B2|nr:Rv3654c family TadE-like protein [Streptomyces sp. BK022]RZU30270.1 secretion/DNA translocation related TadE-like protein [Streptomyces sp. BK022]
MRRREGDRGSATVWSLGVIALLCVVFGTVLGLGHAVVVRHRAAGAADLAALAAADHWAEGAEAACAAGRRVASAQGARLVRCAIVGETSDVSAGSGHGPFAAEVRARAGPADPSGATPRVPASQAPGPAPQAPASQAPGPVPHAPASHGISP